MNIDTSTTAGKIEIMQNSDNGKITLCKRKSLEYQIESYEEVLTPIFWNWEVFNYITKPQTVEEAAKPWSTPDSSATHYDAFLAGAKWQKRINK